MTIKKTKEKGISIVGKSAKVILSTEHIDIIRQKKDPENAKFRISTPGEYELENITIFAHQPQPSSFLIDIEDFNIAYLPKPPKDITKEDFTHYENVDFLLIPGKRSEIATQIAPPFVIPLDDVNELADKIGLEIPEITSSITFKKLSDLPEETEIINLG